MKTTEPHGLKVGDIYTRKDIHRFSGEPYPLWKFWKWGKTKPINLDFRCQQRTR